MVGTSMDEKKLATEHVPTESNIADIATKGLTGDRVWKLMNLMGMNLVAGVECLVRQPIKKITGMSGPDRGMNKTMKLSSNSRIGVRTRKGSGNRTHQYHLWKGVQRNHR